jgi:hypothetical protein
VSNASNTSSSLAFTHVSAFHAGTGEDLARNKAVTASPAFTEPGIATDTNGPHEGTIVLANGGAPLFWEVDLGDDEPVGGLSFGGVSGYNEGDEIQLLEEVTRNVVWSSAVAGAISSWSPQIASAQPWAIEYTHGPTITLHDVDGTSVVVSGLSDAVLVLAATIGPGTMAIVQEDTIDIPPESARLAGQIVKPLTPGLVPLTIANVVSSTPGRGGTYREADNLFDKPGNPFLVGGEGEHVYTPRISDAPNGLIEVVLDLTEAVELTDFSFYSNSSLGRLPRDYEIFSGDSGTGPWTSRATKNLTDATPTGAVTVSVPVNFTARYCRMTFSNMHTTSETYMQLSECRISGMLSPALRFASLEERVKALEPF